MQKVILDTNVVVSALIQKSYPYLILNDLYFERKIELCISEDLMAEYYDVLNREKFARYPDFVATASLVLKDIHEHATLFYPRQVLEVIADPDDNMLLELATESKADYLITGNTNDFFISSYEQTRIISPKEYWELWK